MRRSSISFLLLFCGFSASARAGVAPPRIALSGSVQVRRDTIFLADLLPEDVSPALRSAAAKISLGSAPQAGVSRRLLHSSILAALSANGMPASTFFIPEAIFVQRASHVINREQAYAAIQDSLAKNSLTELPPFRLEDISLNANILVPDEHTPLEVTEVTFDEFIGCARFRLWPKSAPGVHPFYVTVRIPSALATHRSVSMKALAAAFSPPPKAPRSVAPVLVEAGRLTRLHLHSANSSMLLAVIPIQRGHLGETIRVRLPGNGKILQARVIGAGILDAIF